MTRRLVVGALVEIGRRRRAGVWPLTGAPETGPCRGDRVAERQGWDHEDDPQ